MSLTGDRALLAVSRSNSSMEIWKVDSFSQLLVIPGNKNCDIRGLHWLEPKINGANQRKEGNDPNLFYFRRTKDGKVESKKRRLVTTGLNGVVIEWDLLTGRPLYRYNCNCAIWNSVLVGKFLFVSCHDGSSRLLKLRKQKIELIKIICKSNSVCLSVEPMILNAPPKAEKTKKKV